MADDRASARNFEISSVVSRTFELISKNIPLYAGLSLVLLGIPGFGSRWWQFENPTDFTNDDAVFQAAISPLFWLPMLVIFVVSMVATAILQAALTRAAVTSLSDNEPDFGQCLALGLSLIPQLVGIFLINWIAILVIWLGLLVPYGFLLDQLYGWEVAQAMMAFGDWKVILPIPFLLLPGLFLWLCWCVVVPAFVQERIGVIEAFRRSWALTRHVRFRIFLVLLALGLVIWLLSFPVNIAAAATLAIGASPLMVALISGAFSALTGMVTVVMLASIYVELREVKENIAPETLETIFG
ncbi:hypothetical protein P1X14_10425 [Sphingomonas sp. AOB5]|uniref:hypothetical protein n=1 Tax=Sphingomonas sp. AOB5 TaxID=3034017 RepID=UPI0023F9F1AC|nr:hypothetical protein [Sphingomonas sp. AOB5]MDF7775662.1 hypothetical protein [Sphingomonas sp. AOB5]